ncbi:MAG: NAD(P)H-dependent oxidoreductase subunit E [Anaerolineales bacterium]
MTEFDLSPLKSALQEMEGRSALLPALHEAQKIYGYLPEPVAALVASSLGIPLADVSGVIDFYTMLYKEPVGEQIVRVCSDPACALHGSDAIIESLCEHYQVSLDQVSADNKITIERVTCLGLCDQAPAALVGDVAYGRLEPASAPGMIMENPEPPRSQIGGTTRLLTANCGRGTPTSLKEYRASGGYHGLEKTLQMSPAEVIETVKSSGLVGRGGAAFPTGVKLEGAATAPGTPRYVVCNADESEPGTFKDRVLMEDDPQRVLEGLIIAGYAVGARQGYIFVRGEYPRAFNTLEHAIYEARSAGYLGEGILGSDFSFEIELRLGAGAYICGEETALFEAIEGKRGFPRLKPPFPTTHGLFGKPTAINNVETLCNLPFILEHGAAAYRQLGTEKSPGTKLFCLSGDVKLPGLYEAPFGITLRELLFDLAGGMRSEGGIQAILVGGAAGAFAVEKDLDVQLSFEHLQAANLPLGSGVLMVIDQSRDMHDILVRLARFFAHESCGKCYPCQLGTQRQWEILMRLAQGHSLPGDAERLSDVGWTMTDSSLCGLGQTAATAVLSAMQLWPELFTPAGKGGHHGR